MTLAIWVLCSKAVFRPRWPQKCESDNCYAVPSAGTTPVYPYKLYRVIHKTSKYVQHRGITCVKCLFLPIVIDANIVNK